MKKQYHIIVGETYDGKWCPEFGDYDFDVVKEELEDSKESMLNCGYVHTTIISVNGDAQKDIDAAIAVLNGELNEKV